MLCFLFLHISYCVYLALLLMVVVKEHDLIRVAVSTGQRPDLSVINGPGTLKPFAVDWIERCWHQNPDERPTFSGIYCIGAFFISMFFIRKV